MSRLELMMRTPSLAAAMLTFFCLGSSPAAAKTTPSVETLTQLLSWLAPTAFASEAPDKRLYVTRDGTTVLVVDDMCGLVAIDLRGRPYMGGGALPLKQVKARDIAPIASRILYYLQRITGEPVFQRQRLAGSQPLTRPRATGVPLL
jgi:hypothetical protein